MAISWETKAALAEAGHPMTGDFDSTIINAYLFKVPADAPFPEEIYHCDGLNSVPEGSGPVKKLNE